MTTARALFSWRGFETFSRRRKARKEKIWLSIRGSADERRPGTAEGGLYRRGPALPPAVQRAAQLCSYYQINSWNEPLLQADVPKRVWKLSDISSDFFAIREGKVIVAILAQVG